MENVINDFGLIYRILNILRKSMDLEYFDTSRISAFALGISKPKWSRLMAMIIREGFITGAEILGQNSAGYQNIRMNRPALTLKGLEYLECSSLMKKAADIEKENRFGIDAEDFERIKDRAGEYTPPPISRVFMDYEAGILEVNGERVTKPIIIQSPQWGFFASKIFNYDETDKMNNCGLPVLRIEYDRGTGRQKDVLGVSDSTILDA